MTEIQTLTAAHLDGTYVGTYEALVKDYSAKGTWCPIRMITHTATGKVKVRCGKKHRDHTIDASLPLDVRRIKGTAVVGGMG